MKLARSFLIAALMLSLPAAGEALRVPVTDPATLLALGLPADATGVWRLLDTNPPPSVASSDRSGLPAVDGISFSMTGDDFVQLTSGSLYDTDGQSSMYCRSASPGQGRLLSAAVQVPDGRRLEYLDLFGSDTSAAEDIGASLFATCYIADATLTQGIIAQTTSTGLPPGEFSTYVAIPEYYADTRECSYSIVVNLGIGATCEDAALKLRKVRLVWGD